MRRFWLFLPLGVFPYYCSHAGAVARTAAVQTTIQTASQRSPSTPTNASMPSTIVVLPNAKSVTFSLSGVLVSGASAAVNAKTVQWQTSDPSFITARTSDNRVTVTPSKDWFDASGNEPIVTVTARYENLTATTEIHSVINATGTWTATLGGGTTQKLVLSQQGRRITDAKTGLSGTIDGDKLVINSSGFAVNAKFETRNRAVGTFSGAGLDGDFTCTKDP